MNVPAGWTSHGTGIGFLRRTWKLALCATLVVACGDASTGGTPPGASAAATKAPATSAGSETPRPASTAIPKIADPAIRIRLPGTAPAAIAVARDGLWVYSIESGDLTSVNTATASTIDTIHIGGVGSHLVALPDGRLAVGRFDTGGSGDYLEIVDPASGSVTGIDTGPIGSVAVDNEGSIYALEKADRLLRIDPSSMGIVATAPVDIDDQHMEVVVDRGAVWVSSDHTPLRRFNPADLTLTDTLDVGGGIPFVAQRERIWGARPGTLWVLDEDTKKIDREVPLSRVDEILALDVDAGLAEIWLAVRTTGGLGAVLRLDIASGTITGTYPVSLPAAVRMIGSDVLVASYLGNELLTFRRPAFTQ